MAADLFVTRHVFPITLIAMKYSMHTSFLRVCVIVTALLTGLPVRGGDEVSNNPWYTCPPCGDCVGSGKDGASEGAFTTNRPISLQDGAVREWVTDLRIDGPVFSWAQARTYRHQAADRGQSRLGNHWFDGLADFRITYPGGIGNYYRACFGDDGTTVSDFELTISAHSLIPLDRIGSTNEFAVPSDWHLEIKEDATNYEFIVREKYNDKIYIFHSFDSAVNSAIRGRLKEITTRQWYNATDRITPDAPGWEFTYNLSQPNQTDPDDGNLEQITSPPAQDYNISYEYDSLAAGKISAVEVWEGAVESGVRIMRVDYTYFQDDLKDSVADWSPEVGGNNDLIQVKVATRASNDTGNDLSSVRYTQYRYRPVVQGSLGSAGRPLEAIYEHADLMQMVEDGGLSGPEDILEMYDSDPVSGSYNVTDYASRAFEYYLLPLYTDGVATGWGAGNEDLESKYAPNSYYSVTHEYRVKLERIGRASCGACAGGGEAGLVRVYYYMRPRQGDRDYIWVIFHQDFGGGGPEDINEVSGVVVEDTFVSDSSLDEMDYPYGRPLYRTIYGLNDFGRKLREVKIENAQNGSALRCWCQAWTYMDADVNDDGMFNDVSDLPHLKHRVAEYRLPSAYNVTTNAHLRAFLDPYDDPNSSDGSDGSPDNWANDRSVLRQSDGLIYVYDYNDEGLRDEVKVKRGIGTSMAPGVEYYLSSTDWGGGSTGIPADREIATYAYPSKVTSRTDGSRIQTKYEYDFWDTSTKRRLKKVVTKRPAVVTTENGATSGSSDPDSATEIVSEEYYDEVGRLRWAKDGEGYVNYYSYHPSTGALAYTALDVSPGSLPASADASGNSGKWVPSTNGDADGNAPARGGSLPTVLALVTSTEFDLLGRAILRTDPPTAQNPNGAQHYTAYQTANGVDRVVEFPYWDSSAGQPRLPIRVRELDAMDRLAAGYELAPDTPAMNGAIPVGLDSTLESAARKSLTKYEYDSATGRLAETRRYHDTSATTPEFTKYYGTRYRYDAEGRVGATIQGIESGKFQVNVTVYDVLGRPTEKRRAVTATVPTTYAAAVTATTLLATTTYDGGGIGDGHVTKARRYHTASTYTDKIYHRTFRGFLRGVETEYGGADVTPYLVYDVDWLGRTTAAASYTGLPTWSVTTSNEGDASYAASSTYASGRFDRNDTMHDVLGRVYRTEQYPGTNSTNRLQTNNYYDRNDRLVCTGDKYSAHTEYAYDGAGRQYQERVASTARGYNTGVYNYTPPKPFPGNSLSASDAVGMTGGEEGVVEISHRAFDAAGNVTETHDFEAFHDEVAGIDVTNEEYVRRSVFHWYDAADRLTTIADYGARNGGTANTWSWSKIKQRPTSALTWTSADVYQGYALLTTFDYEAATGRQNLITTGVKQNGSNADKTATKTFYDDLGRRTYVAENFVDFAPGSSPTSPTGVGGGSNNDQDRATGWQYDGLSNALKLTAYNLGGGVGSADDQVTEYQFTDSVHGDLVKKTIYPDSATSTDNVQRTYNLDRSLATMTDQRQVVHAYTYNNRRQLELDAATIPTDTSGTGVYGANSETDAIRAIKRLYDNRGRLEYIYSYSNTAATTVLNYIRNFYYDGSIGAAYTGRFWFSNQYHDATTAHAVADLIHDSATSNIYNNGLRSRGTSYPGNAFQVNFEYGNDNPYANADNLDDRLGRISGLEVDPNGDTVVGGEVNEVAYKYNGARRLVETDYVVPDIRRQMFNSSNANVYDAFDRFGRTVRQQWDKYNTSAGVRDQFNYAYDYAGNRLSRDIPSTLYATNDRDQVYAYDGLQRLTSMDEGAVAGGSIAAPTAEQNWTLDALGNWSTFYDDRVDSETLTYTRTHNAANELTSVDDNNENWFSPGHDAAGNLTAMPRPVSQDMTTFRYDAWNRLVAVFNAFQSTTNPVAKYEYDGLHRRIVKQLDANTDGTFNETRHYYYNEKWQVVEERVGATLSAATADVRYVWHPEYVDALALRYWDSDDSGSPDAYHYYLQDANYNVTAVTDNAGAVVERYAYSPYGEPTVLDANFAVDANGASDVENVYLYTGRERDPETGLQLNRERFYTSNLGRWLMRDPIVYRGGDANLYAYVMCKPTKDLDPRGLFPYGHPVTPPRRRPCTPDDPIAEYKDRTVWWSEYHQPVLGGPFGYKEQVYQRCDYQVLEHQTMDVGVAGKNLKGEDDDATLITLHRNSWENPTHETVIDGLRDEDGAWNADKKKYACRKQIQCKSKCRVGCEATWTPDEEYVYGYLEWDNSMMPYCKVDETLLQLARKRCQAKATSDACKDQCGCQ